MQQKVSPAVVGGVIVVLLVLGVFLYMRSANAGSPQQLPAGEGPSRSGYSGGSSPARPGAGGEATKK